MPALKKLVPTLWLLSSLVLLASGLAVPVRISDLPNLSSQTDFSRPNLSLLPAQESTHLHAVVVTDTILHGNALPPENEEQDQAESLGEPHPSFLAPCSFREISDRQLTALGSILSLYPLRC